VKPLVQAYKCSECGHVQETRNAYRVEDESWDRCEECEALESLVVVMTAAEGDDE